MAATPHVRHDYPTSAEAMEAALASLREAVAAAGIPLEVRGGGEIALDALPELSADERVRFGLGGNPRLLLLEFPYYGWPMGLAQTVFELAVGGCGGGGGAPGAQRRGAGAAASCSRTSSRWGASCS